MPPKPRGPISVIYHVQKPTCFRHFHVCTSLLSSIFMFVRVFCLPSRSCVFWIHFGVALDHFLPSPGSSGGGLGFPLVFIGALPAPLWRLLALPGRLLGHFPLFRPLPANLLETYQILTISVIWWPWRLLGHFLIFWPLPAKPSRNLANSYHIGDLLALASPGPLSPILATAREPH